MRLMMKCVMVNMLKNTTYHTAAGRTIASKMPNKEREVEMYLHKQFMPITKNPIQTDQYIELLPCLELAPYIRCFWGSPRPFLSAKGEHSVIIPDACMDIISYVNYSKQTCVSYLSGLNDRYFVHDREASQDSLSTFGIRFHFWSAHLFLKDNYKFISNQFIDLSYFDKQFMSALHDVLIEHETIEKRIQIVEKLLKKRLYNSSINEELLSGVHTIIVSKGLVKINDLSEELCIGQRKLERLFLNNIGLSPKKIADIVRFQNVWREIYFKQAHLSLDLSYKYNYNSESHFITDFKKYFGETPKKTMSFF